MNHNVLTSSSNQQQCKLSIVHDLILILFLCVSQSPQTPFAEQMEEGPLFGEVVGSENVAQAFLSEISEEDVEVLHHREEALLQIEVRTLTSGSAVYSHIFNPEFIVQKSHCGQVERLWCPVLRVFPGAAGDKKPSFRPCCL